MIAVWLFAAALLVVTIFVAELVKVEFTRKTCAKTYRNARKRT